MTRVSPRSQRDVRLTMGIVAHLLTDRDPKCRTSRRRPPGQRYAGLLRALVVVGARLRYGSLTGPIGGMKALRRLANELFAINLETVEAAQNRQRDAILLEPVVGDFHDILRAYLLNLLVELVKGKKALEMLLLAGQA